jgi:hypothetical protein
LLRGDRSLCTCSTTHRSDAAEDSSAASIPTRAVTLLCRRRQHHGLGDKHQELHAAVEPQVAVVMVAPPPRSPPTRCSASRTSWASP